MLRLWLSQGMGIPGLLCVSYGCSGVAGESLGGSCFLQPQEGTQVRPDIAATPQCTS